MQKELLFFPLNEAGQPLYENAAGLVNFVPSGILKPDGLPAHLKYAPKGWDSSLIKFSRNPNSLGAIRDYSIALEYLKDGSNIIKDTVWRQGVDAKIFMAIWKLNRYIFPEEYYNWYTGELDLPKMVQTKLGIRVPITEGGLSKDFKANENTTYEIPINSDPYKKTLFMDGMPFRNNVKYTIYKEQDVRKLFAVIGMGIVSNEGTSQGIVFQDPSTETPTSSASDYFTKSFTKSVSYHIKGNIQINVKFEPLNVPLIIKRYNDNDGTFLSDIDLGSSFLGLGIHNIDFEVTVPITPGYRFVFQTGGGFDPTDPPVYLTIEGGEFVVDYEVVFDDSYVYGLSLKRLCQLLLDKLGTGYTVTSTLLDSLEESIMITSGQALRKFDAVSVIKSSMADFLKSMQRWGIGWSYSGKELIIEKHSYFFKKNKILNLGVVDEYEISRASELIYNTVKVGYPNVEVDKVNGRDEFNVTSQFSFPLKKEVKEYDLVGVYHAGMYEIEVARIDLQGKDTTDSKVDNTVYMLNIEKGFTIEYYVGEFEVISATQIKIKKTLSPPQLADSILISGAASNNGTFGPITGYVFTPGDSNIVFTSGGLTGFPVTLNGTISIVSANNYKLHRPAFSSITGLIHPEKAFNVLLSPKDAFRNNGGLFHSICDYHDIDLIKFTSGDRNSELATVLNGVATIEKSDEPIGGLLPQLFKPYFINCKVKILDTDWDTMNENPYSLIDIVVDDKTFSVYKWDGGRNPVTKKSDEITFLFGPDNDLTKLINL